MYRIYRHHYVGTRMDYHPFIVRIKYETIINVVFFYTLPKRNVNQKHSAKE